MPARTPSLSIMSRAFATLGVATFAILALPADAATIRLTDGSTNKYLECTHNGVTVAANGSVTVTGTGCSNTIGDGTDPVDPDPVDPDPVDPDPVDPTPPPSTGGDYFGRGLWRPSANVMVADQSDPNGDGASSFVPGCLNFMPSGYGATCRDRSTFTGTVDGANVTFGLTQGQVISIRYRVTPGALSQTGGLRLTDHAGGNIAYTTTMSLSTQPGDFNVSNGFCKVTSATRPTIITAETRCNVDTTASIYYLNIRVDSACSACKFVIHEGSNVLY